MALEAGSSGCGGRGWGGGFRSLMRRKQVDSDRIRAEGQPQLAKELNVPELVAIGVGSTVGAGVYVLVGIIAREHAGPALTISFLIAGIAATLSAFCYAELASRCPSAGSAYHYSYICVGEGVAWLIGWALVLEYTIGGSAVARGISPNLALFFGGQDSLPWILARHQLPWFGIIIDPCAAALVCVVTVLLCMGIKESSFAQGVVTVLNAFVMIFVIVAGSYIGFQIGWVGYKDSDGYFPYGVNGMLAGSATVFFAYIGFDTVASTAEEVRNPQRDLPLGIGVALAICCALYMAVSVVIVGLVPYFAMDPDTPISSAFAKHGMQWAMYVVTTGAVLALCSNLMGSLLPQPRILMAMARDGLLPSFFSDVNKQTQVPVKSTIVTGICAAALAFTMDVSQLAGMVSVGTLLAFTVVAVSILILRYVPPDEVPLPPSLQESFRLNQECDEERDRALLGVGNCTLSQTKDVIVVVESVKDPLIDIPLHKGKMDETKRRKIASLSIGSVCIGVLILTSSASATWLPFLPICIGCIIGVVLLLAGLSLLSWIDQDAGRHSFGHSGGFTCPFVPVLPVLCILINTYLLINLGGDTWMRVGIWLLMGVLLYIFYGRTHSSLTDVVYVPVAQADEMYRSSSGYVS
ncbi:cationic amino acid transporter 2, vacuolar isoform X1 [Zea mays]|uniref:Cationic amino acid transporter 4 vacuolar n=1 Tax=Zea mays TaxID=4577 RepID=A0A1D6KZA1_MAIZE|nr:cationic amino acid transporter 2, vacuolar isoform X1 [Zea mays]ONM07695.1 Cationic amino acid transporter 4 vacuolar [Zea mays]ONM07702.1 Cationic amino acid transporter 4 vacuolar [Zea mays]|eukprot:XP_008665173.1 cationic amino acid transporter 2, vacuolar isoform X1 [Zea mays]